MRVWDAHLPTNEESARSATAARALQAGVHREVLGSELDDALTISEQTEIYKIISNLPYVQHWAPWLHQ
jgi:hypothetical protein